MNPGWLVKIIIVTFLGSVPCVWGDTGITGKITSLETGQVLSSANIELENTTVGAATDASGRYAIRNLPPGKYFLRVRMMGYKPRRQEAVVVSGRMLEMDFALEPTVVETDPITVQADRANEKYDTPAALVGLQYMSPQRVLSIPGIFDDPVRAMQIYSGVAGGGDYSGFMSVRGGSPNETLFVLDNVVIPNPYRFRMLLGGGMSLFNPYVTGDVYLHTGGFSAEFGNCLSSVIEVTTRDGNRERFGAVASVNILEANGVLEGPLPKRAGSFILSVRRTYYDAFMQQIAPKGVTYPFAFDWNGKVTLNLGEKNKLSLYTLATREGTAIDEMMYEDVKMQEKAEIGFSLLSWKWKPADNIRLTSSLGYYSDDVSLEIINKFSFENVTFAYLDGKVHKTFFKSDAFIRYIESSRFAFGIQGEQSAGNVVFENDSRNLYFARNEFPRHVKFDGKFRYGAVYFENISEFFTGLDWRFGWRLDYSSLIDDLQFSPRTAVSVRLDKDTRLEGSWGICYQYPTPSSLYTRDQPLDFEPVARDLKAEKAVHYVIQAERTWSQAFKLKGAVFYKDIDDLLLPYDRQKYIPGNTGRGFSRGAELSAELNDQTRRFSAVLSYAYTNAKYRRQVTSRWIPFNYDIQHAASIFLDYKLSTKWRCSVLWRVSSGLPYTGMAGVVLDWGYRDNEDDFRYDWDYLVGERNGRRMKPYQRLDIRLSRAHRAGHREYYFYIDIINLFNHKNMYNIMWDETKSGVEEEQIFSGERRIYMMRFLPSLGLAVHF
ncbi:TonB-dependent receptor [candidate division KSB1 bacterium]|nr:TonB-dependent receptor [candidate division KSB1 bacterium]